MSPGRFCAMIGALIWSPQIDKYLLLKRIERRGGTWECVTGRLEQGESFTDALLREVYEEVGVRVEVDFMLGTAHFYRGAPIVENEMVGVHFCCSLADPAAIRLSEEHSEYRWLSAREADIFLPSDRAWLRTLIARAEQIRATLPPELILYNRRHSCEI
ncbi:MAG: NUDIX domain-containing protein [Caldilineaceae bacterium]